MQFVTPRRGRSAVLAATLALAAGMVPGAVSAGGPVPPGECATPMDVGDIEVGMTGRGWTVVQGDTPEHFRVEVLGVLPNGIAPGKDLIIIEVTDAAGKDFLEKSGGIWAGMSGSPVYINGQLIGAVAYGFTAAPSPVGGVTPAEEMLEVLDYGPPAAAAEASRDAATVRVPAAMRADLAARAGITPAQASEFSRLRVPLAVSGLSARARDRFQQWMDERGIPVIVTPGASRTAPAGSGGFVRPVPGGNFAGLLSYGDVTAGGVGTTTYVCGNQALAFGHPLNFTGHTALGANDADAVRIIRDDTFGSFKMANITGLFGTLDQDRLAAIRAELENTPSTIPVSAHVRDLDTGNVRDGGSAATIDQFVPDVAALTLVSNIDPTIDRIGPGSSKVRWIVNGRLENGDPWTLDRSNRYADEFDISFGSADELFLQLALLESNEFEDISFDSIEVRARVDTEVQQYAIELVKISKNGGPYRERSSLNVQPGDELSLRVKLRQFRAGLHTETIALTVPEDAAGEGFLDIMGGADAAGECFFDPEACPTGNGFLGLVEALENAPKNNDLIADLEFFDFETGESTGISETQRLDREVNGFVEIFIQAPFEG